MRDDLGAFVDHDPVELPGAESGPLAGVTFAVKDIYDVAGTRTGCGNPERLAAATPAAANAPAVQALLDAGARLVGKTHTDELAYSVHGENPHYGPPVNPAARDRLTGGSSAGSAAAVAGGLVDLALGSDTGGSVRVPASYCGLYGLRPSHGRISLEGVMPLAPSFDTVGHFARDPALFEKAGRVLLGETGEPPAPGRILLANDAWEAAEEEARDALRPHVIAIENRLDRIERIEVAADGLESWPEVFRIIQSAEAWANHRAWIESARPKLSPGVAGRLRMGAAVTEAELRAARERRAAIAAGLDELLADNAVMLLPSAVGIAPRRDSSDAERDARRAQTMCLTCIAGLGGLPQVSLPLAEERGCPLGLSLVAARGNDALLLRLAAELGASGA